MADEKLTEIISAKDLGVMIDCKYSASEQVNEARKRTPKIFGAINKNVQYKRQEMAVKLYCAYVRPLLNYCVQAWFPVYEGDC